MDQRRRGGYWLEILLFAISAVLLYRTRVGVFLFLVPLQIVASRRGIGAYLAATGLFLAVSAGIETAPFILPGGSQPSILLAVEAIVVGLFLCGLLAVNAGIRFLPRTAHRLVVATALAGAASVPLILWLSGNSAFQTAMTDQFTALAQAINAMTPPSDAVASSLLSSLLEPDRLRAAAEMILLRSLAGSYLVLLAFSWWAGQAIAARTVALFGTPPRFRLAEYRLESWWLWPLIGAAALVLADLFVGLGAWSYAAWNAALIVLFLFGLQGMAILRFLFEKYRLPRLIWPLAIVVGGSLLFRGAPAAAGIVLLIVPAFGVSENWIRYRIPRSPEPTGES
jgi:hypothetical protein